MTRKEQSMGVPQNNPEAPSHLEEVNFPVYANPNIRQPQDNYYACPRQLALRAWRAARIDRKWHQLYNKCEATPIQDVKHIFWFDGTNKKNLTAKKKMLFY